MPRVTVNPGRDPDSRLVETATGGSTAALAGTWLLRAYLVAVIGIAIAAVIAGLIFFLTL